MTTKSIYRRIILLEHKLINRRVNRKPIGYWEYYYSNGILSYKGYYNDNGNTNGYWEYYYDNGNLHSKGNYDNNGNVVREWHYFNKDGSLKEIMNYDN